MAEVDTMTLGRATATIGPWTRSGRWEGEPPHRVDPRLPREHPINSLHLVRDEVDTAVILAVEDADGCRAEVLGIEPLHG